MKSIKFLVAVLSLTLISTSCASYKRNVASVQPVQKGYQDTAMVNVVSASRMPAAAGSLELSQANADVSVSAELIKMPGETLQHAQLLFVVKNHPEIAGQIMGNSGGSGLSIKFTEVIKRIKTEGLNPKAATAIVAAQNKFKGLTQLGADQREESIRNVLLETRENLLASY